MDPQRAYSLGVRADDCRITSMIGVRSGHWVIYCGDRPVTESASIFAVLAFMRQLRALDTP